MCGWRNELSAAPHRRRASGARRLGWGIVASLVFAQLTVGCSKKVPGHATEPFVRISQRNEPTDLDPATASLPDEFFIIRALSEGLLAPGVDPARPVAATASHYDVSADGLTYTFHLRPGARWSNGDAVTADDFVASYRRVLTPGTGAPKADLFFDVKNARAFYTGAVAQFSAVGIAAPDSSRLVITLERANPRFPVYVASGPWIPVHPATAARLGRQWTQPGQFVGNGPFVLAEWRAQQRIVVKKNPLYHGHQHVKAPGIEFLRSDSGDTEERAFRAGQVDVTMAVPQSQLEVYARERPRDLHRAPLAETRFLSFNTRKPPLDNPQVRRALGSAIDRARLVDRVARGGQRAAHRFLSPELDATDQGVESQFAFDAAHARELLARAGFPGGKGFPRLEITAWSPSQTVALEAMQAMWRQALGIEVAIAIREAKVHLAALHAGDYDIAFVTTILDVPDPLAALDDFTRSATNNFPHWHSERFDDLIAQARGQPTESARRDVLSRAESILLESAAVAPVYFNTKNWLMSPRVKGWREDPLWNRSYLSLHLDEK